MVVIELYPKSGWKSESEYLIANDNEEEEDIQVEKEEQESSNSQQQQQQQSDSEHTINSNTDGEPDSGKVLSGRVVGIFKRNWKTYCGSIEPVSEGTVVGYVSK